MKRYTHYWVEISLSPANSIHKAVIYTDWAPEGEEPKSCTIFNGSYDAPIEGRLIKSIPFLKIIQELGR